MYIDCWCVDVCVLQLHCRYYFCCTLIDTGGSFIGEDTYAETYGPDSVCLLQRRAWEKSYPTESGTRTISVPSYGGGCYKVGTEPHM